MIKNCKPVKTVLFMALCAVLFNLSASRVWAHCDTESGPVAVAARQALETGKFDTIAIWVGEKQGKKLRDS